MKATALNIIRAAACKKRRNRRSSPSFFPFGRFVELIQIIKEHFFEHMGHFAMTNGVRQPFGKFASIYG